MRIIGGKAKGRRLLAPSKAGTKYSGPDIRPTADRAREALFSIIGKEIEGIKVLDLYAGTGALGLEALSRGAEQAVFVDSSAAAVQIIRKNSALCNFPVQSLIFKRDLSKGLDFLMKELPEEAVFYVVFADPPYRKGLSGFMLRELAKSSLLASEALVIIEEDAFAELPEKIDDLTLIDRRRYGDTGFWFYRRK